MSLRKSSQSKLFWVLFLVSVFFFQQSQQQCLTYHQYFDSSSGNCFPCAYNCLTCINSTLCTLCEDQFYLDGGTYTCLKCSFGCKICQDSSSCITCNKGLYIDANGSCLSCTVGVSSCSIAVIQECHSGYFLLGGICAGCLDNCKKCEDFVTCSGCLTGYYLATNKQSCKSCSANCQTCTDSSTCSSCAKGYSISSNACVVEDCTTYPFCIKCYPLGCLVCQQGKYLSPSGQCKQGASILCQQSSGPYFTDCQINNYGCPDFSVIQVDPSTSQQISVCLPFSATQYQEYVYNENSGSNCVSATCSSDSYQLLTVKTRKSYYKVQYHMRLRLYSSSTHSIKLISLNTTTSTIISSNSHNQDISLELSKFNEVQSLCVNCPYGQTYIKGSLTSNGYLTSLFNLTNQNGQFSVKQYVFKFSICTVDKCETCTTVSDCVLCIQPYYLQLVKCVKQCDAGFYKYSRYCLLQCPQKTYSIQSSYQCQPCTAPCVTCTSQTKCLSCGSGYFLEGQSCLTVCSSLQYFGNSTSKECQICSNPCSTCVSVNSIYVKCLSCIVGYLYLQQQCVFICPNLLYSAIYSDISQCASCDSSCTSCYIQSTICEGCVSGYLLYENICNQTTTCSPGYFISTNNVCSPCQFPCLTCQSTQKNCTSCLKGAFYNFQCLSTCPTGYYIQSSQISNITCSACINSCLTCLSSTLCLSCSTGLYLYQNQCKANCPLNTYYQNPLNNSCVQCSAPCKECITTTQCLSCSTGYLDGTTCTLNCNTSSYVNANFQCTICTSPCIECYSQTQCLKCLLPDILQGYSCTTVNDCLNMGKYVTYTIDQLTNVQLNGECKQCTLPCASCSTSSIICLSCVSGYLFVSDFKTCLQSCPRSYYQSNNQCLKCDANCFECSVSQTNCTSCSSGSYLNKVTMKCVNNCADGFYADNQQKECLSCVSPCLTCYNIYLCKSCSTGIFYNKVCVPICPPGTIYLAVTNQCLICTDNCLTCSIVTSNCTACVRGYYFNQNNNTCSSSCVTQFYPNSYTQTCEACISPCFTCSSSVQCLSCVSNYYLSVKVCLLSCLSGYFENDSTFTCDLCNLTICQTCKSNVNNCTTCAQNYYYDSTTSKCVKTCQLRYYSQSTTRTCKGCQFPCSGCLNSSYCTLCETNYKLYQNKCYSSCPISNYYSTTSEICQNCATNCQICSSFTICTKCRSQLYVQSGLCVTDCSIGLYKGRQDITNYDYCLKCPSNCQKCSDFNTCELCVANFYLFNALCLTQCPILHYQNTITLSCQQCPFNCIKCVNSTYCQKCINSYIQQNLCYTQCPSYTYVFNQQQCKKCISPCLQCQSQFTCLTCVLGHFFYHQYCVAQCPKDVWHYPHNKTCAATCPYNKYQEGKICYLQGCGGKLVQLNGYCLSNCPIDYYVSKHQSCIACTSSNKDICDNLFVADFVILSSDKLTLSFYFSQKSQILSSLQLVNITFTDQNNLPLKLTITQHIFTPYSLTFTYGYQNINFITVHVTIPYLESEQSEQAISSSKYVGTLYYFNDYSQQKDSGVYIAAGIIPLVVAISLLIAVLINIITKTSYFLQLLDMMQLIAACLYLQIQYPIALEKFLNSMRTVLFSFMPKLIENYPYTFSSPKYIFYNTDTSFSRTHLLLFLIFVGTLIGMAIVMIINKYKGVLPSIAARLKYRNINDLFSIVSFPLLLFAFSFTQAKQIDIALGAIVMVLTLAFMIFISNVIIQADQMGDLLGLLSDYEPVSSKLGLMYTPFAYIRRFIGALVFCVFPQKPLAALTLLLIFTILILICLFFYQPFSNQITDYVSMYLEFTLIVFIVLIVIIGLDVLQQNGNKVVGVIAIALVSLAMFVGLAWLIYLTFLGTKKFCQNCNNDNQNATVDCIKKTQQKNKSENSGKEEQLQNQNQNQEANNQYSASNLINQKRNNLQNIYSEDMNNSNKEEFKHWNEGDDNQDEQNQQQRQKNTAKFKRPPQMLVKRALQQKID